MFNIFLLRLILASTYTIGKVSFAIVKPLFFVGICMIFSGIILLLWSKIRGIYFSIKKADRWVFIQLAIYQVYLPYAIDFYAAQHTSSYKWALIHAACPFVTALFSWLLLQEVLTLRKCLGLILGIMGLFSTFTQSSAAESTGAPLLCVPELILTISMIIYSYSWIMIQRINAYYSAIFINGVIMVMGGMLALGSSIVCESSLQVSPIVAHKPFLLLMLINILVISAGFPLYTYLLKQYSVTLLAFSSFLEPLFVVLFGWLLLSEIVSIYFISAFALLSLGLYLFYKEELQLESLRPKEL